MQAKPSFQTGRKKVIARSGHATTIFSCFFSLLYQHCNCSLRVASSSERVGWKTCSIATACTNCRRRGKATWLDAPTWSFMNQHAPQVHVSKSFASQFLPSLNLGGSICLLDSACANPPKVANYALSLTLVVTTTTSVQGLLCLVQLENSPKKKWAFEPIHCDFGGVGESFVNETKTSRKKSLGCVRWKVRVFHLPSHPSHLLRHITQEAISQWKVRFAQHPKEFLFGLSVD